MAFLLNYFSTPEACRLFSCQLHEICEFVDSRVNEGTFPWLVKHHMKRKDFNHETQFNFPIYFLAEKDLGEETTLPDWIFLDKGEEKSPTRCHDLVLPDHIEIPNSSSFDYRELGQNNGNEWIGSCDWIGLYYNYQSGKRAIFIRLEKIMGIPEINNIIGASSIVLHELGHALMDPLHAPVFNYKNPKDSKSDLPYIMEEAMANFISLASVKSRLYRNNSKEIKGIMKFMGAQPDPYKLGGEIGKACSSCYRDLTYILKWSYAKRGLSLKNVGEWFSLVKPLHPFTSEDIQNQMQALFK